jgi:hypothetical protein
VSQFVKTERGSAWVFLNLLNDQEPGKGRQCFYHGAALGLGPSRIPLFVLLKGLPRM